MWVTDFLKGRKQRVVLPGRSSRWTSIKSVVSQGSILGHLSFLKYISDIIQLITCNTSIRFFADDTSLYIVVENLIMSPTLLILILLQS